jgi:hypothetical protein
MASPPLAPPAPPASSEEDVIGYVYRLLRVRLDVPLWAVVATGAVFASFLCVQFACRLCRRRRNLEQKPTASPTKSATPKFPAQVLPHSKEKTTSELADDVAEKHSTELMRDNVNITAKTAVDIRETLKESVELLQAFSASSATSADKLSKAISSSRQAQLAELAALEARQAESISLQISKLESRQEMHMLGLSDRLVKLDARHDEVTVTRSAQLEAWQEERFVRGDESRGKLMRDMCIAIATATSEALAVAVQSVEARMEERMVQMEHQSTTRETQQEERLLLAVRRINDKQNQRQQLASAAVAEQMASLASMARSMAKVSRGGELDDASTAPTQRPEI